MGGEEDRLVPPTGVVLEVVNEEAPVARVEPEGEVVEDQEIGILGEDQSEGDLGALSAGHLADPLPGSDLELADEVVVDLTLPAGVKPRIEALDLRDGHEAVLHMPLDEESDLRFDGGRHGLDVVAEHPTSASRRAEIARKDIDRGGLTGAILPQETEDATPRDLEGEVLVDETLPVVVGQVVTLDDAVLHGVTYLPSERAVREPRSPLSSYWYP